MTPEPARAPAEAHAPPAEAPAPLTDAQAPLADAQAPLADAQARLADAQARVVAALIAGGDIPDGFDRERMRAQAASLIAKRRGIVARIRPDAAIAAGPDLASEFAAYARSRTAPPPNYRTDADDFAAWLRDRGRMPEPPGRKPRWWSRLLP